MGHTSNQQSPLPILQVGNVLLSPDILTERFCCDYAKCKGICCIEGNAGAPVTIDEVAEIEDTLDTVWNQLSPQAQAVIDRQGVAYTDEEGDLVTSIVAGKDCVFTCHENGNCLCALEKDYRMGKTKFPKPISCALYPIREKVFSDGTVALNYHRWEICKCGRDKGKALNLPVYQFLKAPLVRRFGEAWYQELCDVASELKQQGYL